MREDEHRGGVHIQRHQTRLLQALLCGLNAAVVRGPRRQTQRIQYIREPFAHHDITFRCLNAHAGSDRMDLDDVDKNHSSQNFIQLKKSPLGSLRLNRNSFFGGDIKEVGHVHIKVHFDHIANKNIGSNTRLTNDSGVAQQPEDDRF